MSRKSRNDERTGNGELAGSTSWPTRDRYSDTRRQEGRRAGQTRCLSATEVEYGGMIDQRGEDGRQGSATTEQRLIEESVIGLGAMRCAKRAIPRQSK
jgi:hypothetical protein